MLLLSRSTVAAGRRRCDGGGLPFLRLTHATSRTSARFYLTTALHLHHHHPPPATSPLLFLVSPNNAASKRPRRRRDEFTTARILQRFFQQRFYAATKMATETKWSAANVRQTFFDFFEKRGHTIGEFQRPLAPCSSCCAYPGSILGANRGILQLQP